MPALHLSLHGVLALQEPADECAAFVTQGCDLSQLSCAGVLVQISAVFTEYQAAAAGGAAVSEQTARRMDGALLAVGALSDILKEKV